MKPSMDVKKEREARGWSQELLAVKCNVSKQSLNDWESGCPQIECNRKLAVHHIDYDKLNLNPNNLISLCISCHVKTNKDREYWRQHLRGGDANGQKFNKLATS